MLTKSTSDVRRDSNAERKKDAAEELDRCAQQRRHVRRGQVQAGKELRHLVEMGQLAPAVLHELPAPVKPNGQQQRALQPFSAARKTACTSCRISFKLRSHCFLCIAFLFVRCSDSRSGAQIQPSSAQCAKPLLRTSSPLRHLRDTASR